MNNARAEKKAARDASNARIAAAQSEARAALHAGKCPTCGQGVHLNSSMTGWVQCDGYGAIGFRKAGAVSCGWQGFTQ